MIEQIPADEIREETTPYEAPNGIEPNRKRRARSDKGIRKGPKLVPEPAPAGTISNAQAAELKRLAEAMCSSAQLLAEAQRRNLQAAADYYAYVDALANRCAG